MEPESIGLPLADPPKLILNPQIFSDGDEAGENSQADAGSELD